jgi:hypothetical protein
MAGNGWILAGLGVFLIVLPLVFAAIRSRSGLPDRRDRFTRWAWRVGIPVGGVAFAILGAVLVLVS